MIYYQAPTLLKPCEETAPSLTARQTAPGTWSLLATLLGQFRNLLGAPQTSNMESQQTFRVSELLERHCIPNAPVWCSYILATCNVALRGRPASLALSRLGIPCLVSDNYKGRRSLPSFAEIKQYMVSRQKVFEFTVWFRAFSAGLKINSMTP